MDDEEGEVEVGGELVAGEAVPFWAYAFEEADDPDGGFEVEVGWEASEVDDISGWGDGVDVGGFGDDGFDVVVFGVVFG